MANIPNLVYAIGDKISTTLTANVSSTALTMQVANTSGMNPTGGYVVIDPNTTSEEIVYVESVSGNTLTIATNGRGQGATTAVAHNAGAVVTDIITTGMFNRIRNHISIEHLDDGKHNFQNSITSWERIAPEIGMLNGRILVTTPSNNLTVSIVTRNGGTPTSNDPVRVIINGLVRYITSSLTLTLNAGTNWFNQNLLNASGNKTYNLFVHLIWDTNANQVRLGLSRAAMGSKYSDYSTTNTSHKFIAISGGTPNSSDAVETIGRITVTTNSANGFTNVDSRVVYGPIETSDVLTYSPTLTPLPPMTISNIVYNQANYFVNGRVCRFWHDIKFDLGGTATATVDIGLPFLSLGTGATALVRNLNITSNQPGMFLVQYNNTGSYQIYNTTTTALLIGADRRIFVTHEFIII